MVRTPSAGRRTRPSVTRSLTTALAVLMGMAKPMPALCPTLEAIMVLMPITSPCQLRSGPPELPGLMAASVWMASSMTSPSGSCTWRMELTMPLGEGAGESEGIADRVNFLADLQIGRIAESHRLQVGSFDLDDGQVMRLVGADDGGLIFLAVVERDFDLARIGDDVIVGEDVSFFVDDEAGALAFLRDRGRKRSRRS